MDTLRGMEPGQLAAEIQTLARPIGTGDSRARETLAELLRRQNPIDIAPILPDLDREEVKITFDLLEGEHRTVVLCEAAPKEQALLLMHVGERASVELIAKLDPDDAADVLEAVEEPEREAVLRELGVEDAREIRELREYGADTAGGLMTPEVIQIPADAIQSQVLEAVRSNPDAETIAVLYVVDGDALVGAVSIRDVLLAEPQRAVREFMQHEVIQVTPEQDQEEVIRLMETYHLGVLPVVDRTGQLLGAVTFDDALTALEDEASEDVMALAGAGGATPTKQSVLERVRGRMPWLLLTLIGGICAAWVIRALDAWFGSGGPETVGDIGKFLPLVAGLAGNVGMQSSAVMLRGFATGEIHRSRVRRVISEEILVAIVNGALCGVVAGILAQFTARDPSLARCVALGISVACAAAVAGTCGTIIPSLCNRLGIDPAISAGPFITTLNDVLGFFIYMVISLGLFRVGA